MKEKIIIFGTGSGAAKALRELPAHLAEIICFSDNNEQKVGTDFEGLQVIPPSEIAERKFDKIMICSSYGYEAIKYQLYHELGIKKEKIANRFYFHKLVLLDRYGDSDDSEIQEIIAYLKAHDLQVFNYDWITQYDSMAVKALWDSKECLWYVLYRGKRMYMKRSMKTEQEVIRYCLAIFKEQDKNSPHKYWGIQPSLKGCATVVDAGTAEGNFALDIIDNTERIYLIENDEEWIEALKVTFRPYQNKVIFIHKTLGDRNRDDVITIDSLYEKDKNINHIKMDIEGAEAAALQGAVQTLKGSGNIHWDICTYHNNDDAEKIKKIFDTVHYQCEFSKGYMAFLTHDCLGRYDTLRLVRGLLHAYKTQK